VEQIFENEIFLARYFTIALKLRGSDTRHKNR